MLLRGLEYTNFFQEHMFTFSLLESLFHVTINFEVTVIFLQSGVLYFSYGIIKTIF